MIATHIAARQALKRVLSDRCCCPVRCPSHSDEIDVEGLRDAVDVEVRIGYDEPLVEALRCPGDERVACGERFARLLERGLEFGGCARDRRRFVHDGQSPKSTVNGIEVGRSRFEHLSLIDFEQHQRRSDRLLVETIHDAIHGVVDLSR